MEYIIVFFLVCIIGILIYLLRIAFGKINLYESFIRDRRTEYNNLYNRIKEIDSRELFEKDDEVGVVFTELKNEIEEFKNILD
jgi:cytochrome c oxidase assembly protein Cox11